jgi:hypothetical protein
MHSRQELPEGWSVDFHFFTDRNFPPRKRAMSPRLRSKELRMCAWSIVPGYDLYIWMDSTFTLGTSDAVRWIVEQLGDKDMAFFHHPDRNTIREEALEVLRGVASGDAKMIERYGDEPIQQQVDRYLAKSTVGFVDDKLWMTGVFIYRPVLGVEAALESWLIECFRYSVLCQISLPYIVWSHRLDVVTLPGEGFSNDRFVFHWDAGTKREPADRSSRRSSALKAEYLRLCKAPGDINEHLPTLAEYAGRCEHVTEMGVRNAVSTTALIWGQPARLHCYDLKPYNEWRALPAMRGRTHLTLDIADVRKITIAPTEMLFIDTWHTYQQLSLELKLHAGKVSRYIVLHDTESFGAVGEDKEAPGLWRAVLEFVAEGFFRVASHFSNCNGLTILERVKWPVTLAIPTLTKEGAVRTAKLIESASHGTLPPHHYFVIDQGGHYSALTTLLRPNVDVYTPGKNIGVAPAWNEALKRYSDMVLIANDDIFLAKDSIEKMVRAASTSDAAVIGCKLELGFPLFIVKQTTVAKIGLFDEQFAPAYGEDNDYVHRLELARLQLLQVEAGVTEPNSGSTSRDMGWDRSKLRSDALAKYIAKWGGGPGQERDAINPHQGKHTARWPRPGRQR